MQPQGPMTRLGRISYAGIAWLLGLPLPIIIIALSVGRLHQLLTSVCRTEDVCPRPNRDAAGYRLSRSRSWPL